MSNAATNPNLIAHTKALEAAGIAIKLVIRVHAPLKPIADQVIRSVNTVGANLAEGHGWVGRERRTTENSLRSERGRQHLKLLAHAGAINRTAAMTQRKPSIRSVHDLAIAQPKVMISVIYPSQTGCCRCRGL